MWPTRPPRIERRRTRMRSAQRSVPDIRRPAFYCYRVASVVGLVCIQIFGYRDPAAEPLAEQCGLAFQLTNIIRDVKEDAAMGRVYLPRRRSGEVRPFICRTSGDTGCRPAFVRYSGYEADRAREYYRAGEQLIPYLSKKTASPRCGCWLPSIAGCSKKSPSASTTYSAERSASRSAKSCASWGKASGSALRDEDFLMIEFLIAESEPAFERHQKSAIDNSLPS